MQFCARFSHSLALSRLAHEQIARFAAVAGKCLYIFAWYTCVCVRTCTFTWMCVCVWNGIASRGNMAMKNSSFSIYQRSANV